MILKCMVMEKKSLNSWSKKYIFTGLLTCSERYDLDSLKIHRQTIQGIYNDCVKMCGRKMLFGKSLSSEVKLLSRFKSSQYISVLIASSCWHLLDMSSGGPAKPGQVNLKLEK